MELKALELKTEERLPWHKPEIKRLSVSLDTADGTSSGGDGFSGSLHQ